MLRAMTLIEMLVSIAIMALVFTATVSSVLSLYRVNSNGLNVTAQISSARRGLDSVLQDLRQMAYGSNGAYPISSMATSSIVFFSNIPNGVGSYLITYQLSGKTLTRSFVKPGTPATYTATPVTSSVATSLYNAAFTIPIFQYFDANGSEITDMTRTADVRSMSVVLQVFVPGTSAPFTLAASTTLRNLKN